MNEQLLHAAQHALDSLLKVTGATYLNLRADGSVINDGLVHITVSKAIHEEARARIAELRAAIHPIIYADAANDTK